MPGPESPKPPVKKSDSPATQSSELGDTDSHRPGEDDAGEIDVRSFLAPAQSEGELGRLERYRVLKELGRGGMGMVLLAEDTQLRRMTAVKVMLPRFAKDPQARERFLREARVAAKLNHDNIVTIHQVDEANGIPFIAMEFLKGEPLDQYLKDKGDLPIGLALRIGREIAEGLEAAHGEGLIHRDIKPANIWLEAPKGRVKILDFGLAREVRDDVNLTKSGAVIGTPAYMSPEQAYGKPLDPRSDLFSLGVVLYRLCTGQPPFNGPNTMAVLLSLSNDEPAPVHQLNPNVPAELEKLIYRLLAKVPERRPGSATEVAEALAAIEKPKYGTLPEVVYVVPAANAVVNKPLADIDATTSKMPDAKLARKTPAPAERLIPTPRQRRPTNGRSKRWLALGAIVLVTGGILTVNQLMKMNTSTDNKEVDSPKNDDPNPPPAKVPALLKAPFSQSEAEKARAEWAAYLKIPEWKLLDLPRGVKLELVLIPPGEFHMGSFGKHGYEEYQLVTIRRPFYMARTETTQEQYEAVVGKNPSHFSANGMENEKLGSETDTEKFPVEQVNWFEAEDFCKAIGAGLPTEAQWEYACRAGTTTDFHFGNSLNGAAANCKGTEPFGTDVKGPNLERTRKVASYASNAFGLSDMHGNVWEWCRDWHAEKTDELGEIDPERKVRDSEKNANSGRVLRGGSWNSGPRYCRSANRSGSAPVGRSIDFGFRIVILP